MGAPHLTLQALDRAMEWGGAIDDEPQTVRRADALAILVERFLSEPPEADAARSSSSVAATAKKSRRVAKRRSPR